METEDHVFLNGTIKDFVAWGVLAKKVSDQIGTLRNRLVEYENRAASLTRITNEKQAEIEALEKTAREKRLLMESGAGQLRDDLERRRNEVADREARITAREAQLRSQQEKLDGLLSAAEAKVKKSGAVAG